MDAARSDRFRPGRGPRDAAPGFVSQECADWLAGLKAEAARRGLDPKDFAQLYGIKAEWEAAHPRPQSTLAQVADHVERVRRMAGVEHVGLGGDFDGTPDVTVGLADVSTYPALFAELLAPRLDRVRLRRPGRRQPPARPPRRRVRGLPGAILIGRLATQDKAVARRSE